MSVFHGSLRDTSLVRFRCPMALLQRGSTLPMLDLRGHGIRAEGVRDERR